MKTVQSHKQSQAQQTTPYAPSGKFNGTIPESLLIYSDRVMMTAITVSCNVAMLTNTLTNKVD